MRAPGQEPAAPDAPIACSLDAGSLLDRVARWQTLVATSVEAVEPSPTRVRLALADSDTALVDAVTLGQQEKQCCPFFEVALEVGAHDRALVLSVPPGAEEALASFVALLTR